jgi:hypothetical protein
MPLDHLFNAATELKRDNWNRKLEKAPPLVDWLAEFAGDVGGWQIFHTATCAPRRRAPDPWDLAERYSRFMHQGDRRRISWFLAIEPNPDHSRLNPGYHGHALWADSEALYGRITWDAKKWWDARHGHNQLTRINKRWVAVVYSSKYLLKDERCLCVWEAAGALWRATRPNKSMVAQDACT